MSSLAELMDPRRKPYDHPLLERLDIARERGDFEKAEVQIWRPRAALGFEPTSMWLKYRTMDGQIVDLPKEDRWDAKLNDELLNRGVRAIDSENESIRFQLTLDSEFQRIERRFGEGFFSAVLVDYVKKTPFGTDPDIAKMLPHITTGQPRGSVDDCRNMFEGALRRCWQHLTSQLKYDDIAASSILTAAVRNYLDERFTVTERRNLGWLFPPNGRHLSRQAD